MVVASADTLATRPGTVAAFTLAHVRALQDLRARLEGIELAASPDASPAVSPDHGGSAGSAPSSPRYGDPILEAASAGGLEVPADMLADWPAQLATYLPFDGGFDEGVVDGDLEFQLGQQPDLELGPAVDLGEATLPARDRIPLRRAGSGPDR